MTEAIESSKDQKSSIIQYPPDSKLTHYSWIIIFSFTFLELLNKIYVHKFYHKNISINDSTHNSKSLINTLFIFRSLASDYLMSKSYCQTKGPEDDQKTKGKSKKKRKKNKEDSLDKEFEFAL